MGGWGWGKFPKPTNKKKRLFGLKACICSLKSHVFCRFTVSMLKFQLSINYCDIQIQVCVITHEFI